jgi:hypothetical protein
MELLGAVLTLLDSASKASYNPILLREAPSSLIGEGTHKVVVDIQARLRATERVRKVPRRHWRVLHRYLLRLCSGARFRSSGHRRLFLDDGRNVMLSIFGHLR